jgi:hypothetical protein
MELSEITNTSLPAASLEALKSLRNSACESSRSGFKLQSQQRFLRRVLSPDSPVRNLLMVHGTGTGKCHGIDTPILMRDGSIKMVQDVCEGDVLMGDDSTPRQVLSLARGRDEMFEITSIKGESYVVNSEHILCLQHTSTRGEVTEITVKDYLQLSKKLQRNLKGYRTGVEFAPQPVLVDPYMIGVWLGDGSKRDPVITSQDARILKYVRDFCAQNNAVLTFQSNYEYRMSAISKKHSNVFLDVLKAYNLLNNKHVPREYKINSREVRLQVLAGLIDTDGYLTGSTYEITQKSKQLSDDIVFLARSLGFATSTTVCEKACMYKGERRAGQYYRTHISGQTDEIPVKILRKMAPPRQQIKDPLRYGIMVKSLGEGEYYGFTLDGNNRYVLGDFTVTHNTCTAIQIAEEYILRPEFQDKRVMVVASRAVEENFRTQLFEIERVNFDALSSTLDSKQCTGRRYLDMLLRVESDPRNWNDSDTREKLQRTADRILDEFYEFGAYGSFGNMITEKKDMGAAVFEKWVHETFDNRLLIIDEAHNATDKSDNLTSKAVASGLESLVKTANGLVLVLLTATPMFDTYDEIVFFMNLFLWNDRKQALNVSLKTAQIFDNDAKLKDAATFQSWCETYVSYVKGENPFTFPFRLPPPRVVSRDDLTTDYLGTGIATKDRIKYLSLVGSEVAGIQKDVLVGTERTDSTEKRRLLMQPTVSVFPENKTFAQSFRASGKQYAYVGEPFLTPTALPNHSAKISSVLKSIQESEGIALVYSNFVEMGSRVFAMAAEEHGFTPAIGTPILANPAYTGESKGKYILLTSGATDAEISKMLSRVKSSGNLDGADIKIIISSPIVSEGIDFRYIRQIHILDPWWNMSRVEQVIGRGLRTCSHQLLPFEKQNCTVYLHVCRTGDGKECYDEYTYRTKIEQKAIRIARVRKALAEYAMDCPLQNTINTLPQDWKDLEVPQVRAEGPPVAYRLSGMLAPAFDDSPDVSECKIPEKVVDPEHVRPLSAYLDVRDEILEKLAGLFIDKPIWDRQELFNAMRPYTQEVVVYNLQQAIQSAFRFKDAFSRPALLESKGDLYAIAPIGTNGTMVSRTTKPPVRGPVDLPVDETKEEPVVNVAPDILALKRAALKLPADALTRFSEEVLNGYVFDHMFTDVERRAYLKTRPGTLPFESRLYVPDSEYIVLGDDSYEPAETPIGDDLTNLRKWNAALVARFIGNKQRLFASVTKDGKFTVSKFTIAADGTISRTFSSKTHGPVVCGTGTNKAPDFPPLAKLVDKNGVGIPGKPGKRDEVCIYTELLMREEHNCVWVTREELSVLFDNAANRTAIGKEFNKK